MDAEIVAAPTLLASTTPLVDTVATVLGVLAHETAASGMTAPLASRPRRCPARALRAPISVLLIVSASVRGTGTGADTTTTASPDLPSTLPVITAEPAFRPATWPFAFTLATVASEEVQETELPVRMFDWASRTVAFACAVWPTVRVLALSVTDTEAARGASGVETVSGTIGRSDRRHGDGERAALVFRDGGDGHAARGHGGKESACTDRGRGRIRRYSR